MKRISLLVVLMVLWANVAFAANWVWSCSSAEIGCFFDTTDMHYGRKFNGKTNFDVIYFWEKKVYDPSFVANSSPPDVFVPLSYSKHKCSINVRDKTYTIYEDFYYDEHGKLLLQEKREPNVNTIVPDSYFEKLFIDVWYYAHTHLRFDSLPQAN